MTRCREVMGKRVKGDTRVQIDASFAQTVRMVFEKAKDKLWETKEAQKLTVVAGDINDVLRGNGASIGMQVTKRVKDLRVISRNVQTAAGTVPKVQGQKNQKDTVGQKPLKVTERFHKFF